MTQEIVPVVLVSNEEYWLPYALECTRGYFLRYIIYDIGSTDKTKEIIKWWAETNPNSEMEIKLLPMCEPKVQGFFRNSMIAEAQSDYYFILDGDELYSQESIQRVIQSPKVFDFRQNKLYGVVRRIEVSGDLKQAYGVNNVVPHHRLYHRTAYWRGPHPGEYPAIEQTKFNEIEFQDIICYHFHNAQRSPQDHLVPKRLERRAKPTYRPGNLNSIDIFGRLPILKKPIESFTVSPELKALQDLLK